MTLILAIAFSAVAGGCGTGDRPPLGTVTGVVTVDGKTVRGLGVLFSQAGFRSSSGFTDADGKYELKYVKNTMGAAVGTHQVRIDYVSREGGKRRMQLPQKYNRKSELTAQVEPGNNKINFELDSE